MVCILDSTVNFKEMHKLKLYAVYKGELTFSFMGSNEKASKGSCCSKGSCLERGRVLLPLSCEECSAWTRPLLPLSCEECSVHCAANCISHTLCFKQTRSCFSKNILFFSFHTLNIFLLSTLVYIFNLQCW